MNRDAAQDPERQEDPQSKGSEAEAKAKSGTTSIRRKGKKSRRSLDLGNRFARLEQNLELPDPDFISKQPGAGGVEAPTEISPEIWEFFNRETFEKKFFGGAKPEAEARTLPRLEAADSTTPKAACDTIHFLLVEDNPGHVRLMQEALKESKAPFTMTVLTDGVQAMEFLRREGEHKAAKRPHLVLLDLNLPKKSGREVLTEIKADEGLASIPVVILTASTDKEDIERCYDLNANCYLSKPTNLNEFANVVKMIENFWGSFVRLP